MSTPAKYRKKPVVIEAMQMPEAYPEGVDPSSDNYARNLQAAAVLDFLREHLGEGTDIVVHGQVGWTIDPSDGALYIGTLEGVMRVSHGDYVIRGVQGEFYPCKPDIFEATYETAEATR